MNIPSTIQEDIENNTDVQISHRTLNTCAYLKYETNGEVIKIPMNNMINKKSILILILKNMRLMMMTNVVTFILQRNYHKTCIRQLNTGLFYYTSMNVIQFLILNHMVQLKL